MRKKESGARLSRVQERGERSSFCTIFFRRGRKDKGSGSGGTSAFSFNRRRKKEGLSTRFPIRGGRERKRREERKKKKRKAAREDILQVRARMKGKERRPFYKSPTEEKRERSIKSYWEKGRIMRAKSDEKGGRTSRFNFLRGKGKEKETKLRRKGGGRKKRGQLEILFFSDREGRLLLTMGRKEGERK